ncbi:hypothetical protein BD289DRAFT_255575 [Coniella lustricola]|uniref:Uncharacterized protein n=1 Tax=Coniella lustricola TaxID=2025994 RepID=A0A2T3AKQ7_9PEZI|nr:hypothetical protein BD289DRAFT_255575 [Coniella lustricola]
MAASFTESPAQFERDLRSANKEWKRGKDANAKWSYGSTSPNTWWASTVDADNDTSFSKARPLGKPSEDWNRLGKDRAKLNKFARTGGRVSIVGNKRVRSKMSVQDEIEEAASGSRSILDYLPGSPQRQLSNPLDQVLYSFDRTDSPGRPLTLEVFVKTTGRETEKFVEKEYEVIDANGDALSGRKARSNLRRGTAGSAGGKSAGEEMQIDEDGFELI